MLNDFLPAIISVGILASAFLFVWASDIRNSTREYEEEPSPLAPLLEMEPGEPSLN